MKKIIILLLLLTTKCYAGDVTITSTSASGAPIDATYITQIPNATLTNEQALSSLSPGLMKNTAGVVSSVTDNSSTWNTALQDGTKYVPYNGATGSLSMTSYDISANRFYASGNSVFMDFSFQSATGSSVRTASANITEFYNNSATSNNLYINSFVNLNNVSSIATPSVNNLRIYGNTTQGHTRPIYEDDDGILITIGRDNFIIAKNTSGSQINKGQAVYITGSTGNVPNIGLAKADSLSTLPAIGIVVSNISINGFGYVQLLGVLSNFDTSGFTTGDRLYVSSSTAGGLVSTRPVYPNYAQRMGSVLVSGVGNGSIQVTAAPFLGTEESGTNQSIFRFANIASAPVLQVGTISATGGIVTLTEATASSVYATNFASATTIYSNSFIRPGGTSSQFFKADGSIDSSTYLTTVPSSSGTVAILFGGTSTQISTNSTLWLRFPYNCTLTEWSLSSVATPTIFTVDLWKTNFSNFNVSTGTSLTSSTPPNITNQIINQDTSLSGWTKSISAGDYVYFQTIRSTGATQAVLTLGYTK